MKDMKLQKLLSLVRKAVDDYHMIADGDRIAVGVSGGKDSLALLYTLKALSRFYPHAFDVCAITVDLGFDGQDFAQIQQFCDMLSVPFTIVPTQIAHIVFEERQEDNPCALCSKMRKGALNHHALKLGCTKIAYAHHKDDVVETMLLSLLYEGRLETFWPVTHLEQTGLTLIRPMLYVKEADVKGFVNRYQLPVAKSPCPADGHTKREEMKQLLKDLNHQYPNARERIFHGIAHSHMEGWNRD